MIIRFITTILVVIYSLFIGIAHGEEGRVGSMTFSFSLESYPGKLFYRVDGVRYISGMKTDQKYQPRTDDVAFKVFSLRIRKLYSLGNRGLSTGLEIGMSLPISGYEKSWNLPALAPKFTGDIYFPSFC